MKYLNNFGISIFLLFLSLNFICCLHKKKQVKKVKESLISDANNLAIAVLLRKMGSKQTYHHIVKNLNKKCKDLKILDRTKTSLKFLRKKFGFVRKSLKKQKLHKSIQSTFYNNFITRLFKRLLKCSVINRSKVAWKLKKSIKRMNKGMKLKNVITSIKKLVKATDGKRKPRKEFFSSVRKYYRFLNRKKLIMKIIKNGTNPIKRKNLSKSEAQRRQIKNLSRNIKKHLKRCVMFKGKFAQKGCDKAKLIRRKIRKISKKLYNKLSKNCNLARSYCIQKGSKKFCRKAYKTCKNVRKLKKKIANSSRMRNATYFAKTVGKIISNILVTKQ